MTRALPIARRQRCNIELVEATKRWKLQTVDAPLTFLGAQEFFIEVACSSAELVDSPRVIELRGGETGVIGGIGCEGKLA